MDSNPRHSEPQSDALPTELQTPYSCGSEIRTHVVQLMRLSWDHLQSIPRFSSANGTRTRTPALKGQSPNQLVYSAILYLRPTTVTIRLFYMSDSHVPHQEA